MTRKEGGRAIGYVWTSRHDEALRIALPDELSERHVAVEIPDVAGKPDHVRRFNALHDVLKRSDQKDRVAETILARQLRIVLHSTAQQTIEVREKRDLMERDDKNVTHGGRTRPL